MEPNQEERAELARRIARVVLTEYGDNKRLAYTNAEVNSGTFDKALAGQPLAARTRAAIIRTFWPDTGGDWKAMEPPLHSSSAENGQADDEEEWTLEQVRRYLAAARAGNAPELLVKNLENEVKRLERGAS